MQARMSFAAFPVRFFTQVNAAVPAHEAEMRSFGADYDEFMKKQNN
jgi:hypothetical protein